MAPPSLAPWLALVVTAGSSAELEGCYSMGDGDALDLEKYPALVSAWLAAGAQPAAAGYGLEQLVEHMEAEVELPDSPSAYCSTHVLSVFLTVCLFMDVADCYLPWGSFLQPWEHMLRSPWPVFNLTALWAKRRAHKPDILERLANLDCNEVAADILAYKPVSLLLEDGPQMVQPTARLIVSYVMNAPTFGEMPFLEDLCGRLAWGLFLTASSLAHDDPLVPPGYTLRWYQTLFLSLHPMYPDDYMDMLAEAPWNVLEHLPLLVSMDFLLEPDLDLTTVSHNSSASELELLTRDALAPFTPVPRAQAEALEATLAVTHQFLKILNAPYMLIAGSLLGAIRHMGRIPWDDDVDLCVDSSHEMQFVMLAICFEAERLNLPLRKDFPLIIRRAFASLHAKKYILQIKSSRALVFRIKQADSTAHVDIWQCFYLAAGKHVSDEVILMSKMHGPKIPRGYIEPLKKLPFDSLALWVPSDPEAVTDLYFEQQYNQSVDFMTTCVGRKVHAAKLEIQGEVPCDNVADLATPWMRTMQDKEQVFEALEAVLHRIPGISYDSKVTELWHSFVGGEPRYLVQWEGSNARLGDVNCAALLWKLDPVKDLELPGMLTELPLRSLICGHSGLRPHFTWEDAL